jgi:hypothetical protein
MPNKIAEAQFFHVAEQEGLLNLTLSLNGEPVAHEVLDNFAFAVHTRFRQQQAQPTVGRQPPTAPAPPLDSADREFRPAGVCAGA